MFLEAGMNLCQHHRADNQKTGSKVNGTSTHTYKKQKVCQLLPINVTYNKKKITALVKAKIKNTYNF